MRVKRLSHWLELLQLAQMIVDCGTAEVQIFPSVFDLPMFACLFVLFTDPSLPLPQRFPQCAQVSLQHPQLDYSVIIFYQT